MSLIERLEKRAKELDRRVKNSLPDDYSFSAADDRELLEETIKRIETLEWLAQ